MGHFVLQQARDKRSAVLPLALRKVNLAAAVNRRGVAD